jgi:tetratricopeptide (TPR) repeat protein
VVVAAPTPPNLAHAPFSPAHGPSVSASGAARHASACAKARAALDAGDVATAVETARAAVAIDPAHALGHWLLGTALGRAGETEAALAALVRAHALDTAHKRSLRGYVREAEEVCRELGCVAVDIDAALRERARAEGPAVYGEVFGDHEHLTVAGNRWVGERIVGAILAAR